jgi:predicted ester cyclase
MRKLLCGICVALIITSCNNNSSTPTPTKTDTAKTTSEKKSTKPELNKQKAIASDIAFSNHDAEGVYKDASPDALDYGDGTSRPLKTDSAKLMCKEFFKSMPDIKVENITAIAEGDIVIVLGDWSGTFNHDMGTWKSTGKVIKWRDCDIFKFNEAGQITEHKSIYPLSTLFVK